MQKKRYTKQEFPFRQISGKVEAKPESFPALSNSSVSLPVPAKSNPPTIASSKLYAVYSKLKTSLASVHQSILTESTKNLISIKKATAAALLSLKKIELQLLQDLKSNSINAASLLEIKESSMKLEAFSLFNLSKFYDLLDIEIIKNKPKLESRDFSSIQFANNNPPKAQANTFIPSHKNWGTISKQGKYSKLPEWIVDQIEKGIAYNSKEIFIYQNSNLVSIADLKEMRYYYATPDGKRSGKGQTLIMN